MMIIHDILDRRLLDEWQRNFPLVERPFAVIGNALGSTETDVLRRLARLSATGAVSRVGATLRPNIAGASTLATVATPDDQIEKVAGIIGAEPGVNHSYLRENEWNIWFVATGPDREHVDATLHRIEAATGLPVLDLPLVQPYHLDLGFSLDGARQSPVALGAPTLGHVDATALRQRDRVLLQALTQGLAITPLPFATLASALRWPDAKVLERICALITAGIVSRMGIIVRHRALGWRSNAMVVWQVPESDIDRAGVALAAAKGVTLCYQRRNDLRRWPYNLYCMIHARSRGEALDTLSHAASEAGLDGISHRVLFSVRCFKQTGAMVLSAREAAA